MKNLKVFTIVLLTHFGIVSLFSSCETSSEDKGDETTESNKESEDISLDYNDCLGDYVGLETDINKFFITPIKDGSIIIGKTSKSEIGKITSNPDGLAKDYDGISLTAIYTYKNDVIQSISIDCFYQCEGALDLLPVDQAAILNSINATFGEQNDTENWSVNGSIIKNYNFEDGYGISIKAAI